MQCRNATSGCKWEGQLYDLDSHTTNSCRYTEVECPNHCSALVKRKDVDNHKKKCPKRLHTCKHCREEFVYHTKEEHDLVCKKKVVKCKNTGCSVAVERERMAQHVENCRYQQTACKYDYIGCTVVAMRKDIKRHEEDNKIHLLLALDELKKTQDNLKAESENLQTTQDLLQVESDKVTTLKQELRCASRKESPSANQHKQSSDSGNDGCLIS